MNDHETSFDFPLSPAELHWLAGAFGLIRLPLPDDPLRYMPFSQREIELKKAVASLGARGLISQTSAGYQVDRLPAAIIQWLGSAANMLKLDIHARSGIARRAQVFSREGMSMYVSLEEERFHFLFLPDGQAVSDYLLNQLGAAFLDPKPAAVKFAFSQPITILCAAWKDRVLAAKMLEVTHLKAKEIKPLLVWAESLEWVATLTQVQLEGKEAMEKSQTLLCGNKHGCWAGRVDSNPDEPVQFSSMNEKETRTLLESAL